MNDLFEFPRVSHRKLAINNGFFFFLKEQYGIKKTQLFGNSFLNANIKKYLWVIIFNVIVTHSLCSYHLPSSHCSEEGMVTPIL